jgi:hypothetical protein
MLMADTMSIFFVILGVLLAFSGLWLMSRGLWPEAVEAAAARCGKRIWPYFLAGIPLTLTMIVLTRVLFLLGPVGKIAGVAVVCFYMLQANIGVSGLVTAIGSRLSSPLDQHSPWRATLRGGIALELSYLLPILGWFVVLPASIVIGTGAINVALLSRLRIQTAAQPSLVQNHGAVAQQAAD